MVSKDSYINKTDKVAYRIIDHEAMVVTSGSNKLYVFNRVGSKIWELANGKTNIKEIAGTIHEKFNVAYEQALEDTIEFAEELSRKTLLEVKS